MEKTTHRSVGIRKGTNLIGKGKHMVKAADQPLLKVERLKDKSSKIITIHNK